MTVKKKGRVKHIPQRTCVVCGETSAKRTLIRVVRTSDEGVRIDPTGKRSGRGAYLCHKPLCWQKATQSEILGRALRTTLTGDDREHLIAAAPSTE